MCMGPIPRKNGRFRPDFADSYIDSPAIRQ
jgi:hypothetical protein